MLLGDEVGTSLSSSKGTKTVLADGLPHLSWVHSEDVCCLFNCEVLHVCLVC